MPHVDGVREPLDELATSSVCHQPGVPDALQEEVHVAIDDNEVLVLQPRRPRHKFDGDVWIDEHGHVHRRDLFADAPPIAELRLDGQRTLVRCSWSCCDGLQEMPEAPIASLRDNKR